MFGVNTSLSLTYGNQIMPKKLTYTALTLLALILPLTACDNSGTNQGTYRTHQEQDDDQSDEEQAEYCQKHPKYCQ